MLLAILFNSDDCIAAAAMACDQQPYGETYWAEIHPVSVSTASGFETAYLEIMDELFCQQLLTLHEHPASQTRGRQLATELSDYLVNQKIDLGKAA